MQCKGSLFRPPPIVQRPVFGSSPAVALTAGEAEPDVVARHLSDDAQARFELSDGLWTVDLNWAWQFSGRSSVSASIRNMFAEEPPARGGSLFNRNRRTYSVQYLHSFAN